MIALASVAPTKIQRDSVFEHTRYESRSRIGLDGSRHAKIHKFIDSSHTKMLVSIPTNCRYTTKHSTSGYLDLQFQW